jgi:hypothetical protein
MEPRRWILEAVFLLVVVSQEADSAEVMVSEAGWILRAPLGADSETYVDNKKMQSA